MHVCMSACVCVCDWKYNHEAATYTSMQSSVAFRDGGVWKAREPQPAWKCKLQQLINKNKEKRDPDHVFDSQTTASQLVMEGQKQCGRAHQVGVASGGITRLPGCCLLELCFDLLRTISTEELPGGNHTQDQPRANTTLSQ